MIPRDLYLLLPCRGLEDFPRHLPSADSDNLLSAWLALWHPSLIAAVRAAPRCVPAAQPPVDFVANLAVLPRVSAELIPTDLEQRFTEVGGVLAQPTGSWQVQQAQLLAKTTLSHDQTTSLTPEWLSEFAALGFAFLQIQLLTRQMRYTSNLDQLLFDSQLFQAAEALLSGSSEEAERMLQSCFDQLGQERDHFYSLDINLLDITLVAPSTLGTAISKQLAQSHPTTFVASANLLRQLDAQSPTVATELRSAVAEGKVGLAGGLDIERPHPLMTTESIKRDLERGRRAYAQLGFTPPQVFTRFSFGQSPEMPMHLRRSGFIGVLLVAWDDGNYPTGSHAKFSWEAAEGTFLTSVTPPLVDSTDPASYLALGHRLGEALDHQHVPVFAFAHWPGQSSPYFDLLKRVMARTPAIGRWSTIEDFFEKTDQPYHQEQLPASQFSYDWLAAPYANSAKTNSSSASAGSASSTTAALDLVSLTRRYQHAAIQARSLQSMLNLCFQLEKFSSPAKPSKPAAAAAAAVAASAAVAGAALPNTAVTDAATPADQTTTEQETAQPTALSIQSLSADLSALLDEIDSVFDQRDTAAAKLAAIELAISSISKSTAERFARAAGYRLADGGSAQLLINPSSSPQRLPLVTALGTMPIAESKWAYASGATGLTGASHSSSSTSSLAEGQLTMCDVPPLGMVRADFKSGAEPAKRRERTLADSTLLLMNDFLEAQIDSRTGAMRSLHVPGKRGNRLSFQIARRERSGSGSSAASYSQMRASSVRVVTATPVLGVIRASGRLMMADRPCGDFEIDYEIMRGQRVLAVNVKLSSLGSQSGSVWNAGYVLRTAWPTEAAILTTHSGAARQTWTRGKTVAPLLINIDETEYNTQLLPGGLAFHQRVEERFMETLLSGPGTSQTDVCFGIGVDLPSPLQAARQFVDRVYHVPIANAPATAGGSTPASSWLMHIDAKSVLMELDSPLVDADGRCCGIRIHLQESANKSAACRIRSLREVAEAHRVDYLGGRISKLTTERDTTSIVLRPNEMVYVDLLWQ